MMNRLWLTGAIVITLLIAGCLHHREKNGGHRNLQVDSWAYQLQGADPEEISRSGFDLVVMDYSRDGTEESEYSRNEIERIRDSGVLPIAYLSIGEAEDYRFYWREEWRTDPPGWLGRENPEWEGNYAVRYWDDEWREILHTYLDRIVEQGFSGIYLDKVDEFEYWSDPDNGEGERLPERESALRMIDLIVDIAKYARARAKGDFYIIPQNGERILKYDTGGLIGVISGWAAEDLFYDGTELCEVDEERFLYLDQILSEGRPVLSVDYVDDGSGYSGENKRRIEDYRERALERGYVPYVARSDRELDELNVIDGVQPLYPG